MTTLLELRYVYVDYALTKKLFSPTPKPVKALNGISFKLAPAQTMGLVGESGSGKSTLAKAILQLTDVRAGTIHFDGIDIATLKKRRD